MKRWLVLEGFVLFFLGLLLPVAHGAVLDQGNTVIEMEGVPVRAFSNADGTYMLGVNNANLPTAVAEADAAANPSVSKIGAYGHTFNGTTWDRLRGNVDTAALITAAGATTTQATADQTNYNGRCVKVVLDMTTVGTGSVTPTIQGKDAASGKYYTLLAGAAVVTNVTNVYTVCPGVTATANVSASDVLPRTWRVNVVANNANPTTYTLGASVIN
jgi:hypothetical protein